MTIKTHTQKDGTIWTWEETPETIEALQELNKFAKLLYVSYSDIQKKNE